MFNRNNSNENTHTQLNRISKNRLIEIKKLALTESKGKTKPSVNINLKEEPERILNYFLL